MSKITKSAKGRDCTIRLMGCNHNPETTVLAHISGIRFGHGVGRKVNDMHAAYACSYCHDAVDGRIQVGLSKEELKLSHYEGMIETQMILLEQGLLWQS